MKFERGDVMESWAFVISLYHRPDKSGLIVLYGKRWFGIVFRYTNKGQ